VNLDQQLRRALERQEPSPDFADRVLAARTTDRRRAPRWIAMAVAASAAMVVGANQYRAAQQRAVRAERAARDVKIALAITGEKLNEVQIKLADIARRATP
jgi:hypothetical protein